MNKYDAENYEIVEELLYLVGAEPNDQTLGRKVREFIDNLPTSLEHWNHILNGNRNRE